MAYSERTFFTSKRFGFKDVLFENSSFPKEYDEFDKVLDIGKKMARIIKLIEISCTELILSINVKASYDKIALNIVQKFQD
jgi:hypothetical protein